TSATTGQPKLVPLTAENLHAIAVNDVHVFGLTAADRLLSMSPLFHSHGLAHVLTQLSCGGSVVCTRGLDPDRGVGLLDEFRPTWTSGGPPLLNALFSLTQQQPAALRRVPLRFIRSSGASAMPELVDALERAAVAPVLEGYGLTEAIGAV